MRAPTPPPGGGAGGGLQVLKPLAFVSPNTVSGHEPRTHVGTTHTQNQAPTTGAPVPEMGVNHGILESMRFIWNH